MYHMNDYISKGWSQNRVKIFYFYNIKIEGGGGLRIFICKDSKVKIAIRNESLMTVSSK